jgi:signal transduction histidine kinase
MRSFTEHTINTLKFILLIFPILACYNLWAYDTLLVKTPNITYNLNKEYFSVFATENKALGINEILELSQNFEVSSTDYIDLKDTKKVYWVKFSINNENSDDIEWLFEGYVYRTQEFSFYFQKDNRWVRLKQGYTEPSSNKYINHKNFVFPLHIDFGETKTYYMRLYHPVESTIQIPVIKSSPFFTSYSLTEYILLGMFYGCITIMIIYNLLLFCFLKEKSHLYYVLYIFFGGLFFVSHDGIGNQYLWNGLENISFYMPHISIALQVLFLYLYVREFIKINEVSSVLNGLFFTYAAFRILILLIGFSGYTSIFVLHYADVPSFLFTFVASILAYKNGQKHSKFFIIAFSFVLLGFMVYLMRMQNIIPTNNFTFYFNYITTLIEMLMLSLALGDKFSGIKKNESIQTELNKILEQSVSERTLEIQEQKKVIEEKVKDLDTLIYRASHDIKGPLKSILGLTNLGIHDLDNAKDYLQHIETSVKKLDNVINNLININRINSTELYYEKIEITELIDDCRQMLNLDRDEEAFKIITEVQETSEFYSNQQIVYSAIQNIIENAYKYRKTYIANPQLKISGVINEEFVFLNFSDNGIGIPQNYVNKIFDMFFRADSSNKNGSGLGLYLTKTSLNKLGGFIEIQSELGFGTIITIKIPNKIHSTSPNNHLGI